MITLGRCDIEKSDLCGKLEIERFSRESTQRANFLLFGQLENQTKAKNDLEQYNMSLQESISNLQQDYYFLERQNALLKTENYTLNKKYTQAGLQNKILQNSLQTALFTTNTLKPSYASLLTELQTLPAQTLHPNINPNPNPNPNQKTSTPTTPITRPLRPPNHHPPLDPHHPTPTTQTIQSQITQKTNLNLSLPTPDGQISIPIEVKV